MSISVKSISVSIDGTLSDKFKIKIGGAQYNLDNFKLEQRLLEPNRLTFTMCKDPVEDISEPQFTVCRTIIGKPVKLNLQTDSTELDIAKFVDPGRNADIEFDGVITKASAQRSRSQYKIKVEACSWDALLKDNPNCKSFEDMSLQDIVFDVITSIGQLQATVNPRFEDSIPYTVQYNENNYEFLQRLARRYGEWFFNDGTVWHFGQLGDPDTTTLKYPSQDVPTYSVKMDVKHVPFKLVANSYNANDSKVKEGKDDMQTSMNPLNDSVFDASNNVFTKETWQNLHSGGYALVDSRDTVLDVASKTQARGERANMLTYEGSTYCSKLKLGSKLVIKDNYITSADTNDKSEVPQDEILITNLVHKFSCDEVYSNTFEGIPAASDYPPYQNQEVYPNCPPERAKVVDNEDPDHFGRVRVQFSWQLQQDPSMFTPWLRIAQPYGGLEKGFSFIPEVDEEVLVDFECGNAERPYVRGTFFNGVDKPDEKWFPGENEVKALRTKNGHTIEIHDKGKGGRIEIYDNKKNNYKLTFSTDNKSISLEAKGDISLKADENININAGKNITIHADENIDVSSGKDTKIVVDGKTDGTFKQAADFKFNDTLKVTVTEDWSNKSKNKKETVECCYELTSEFGESSMKLDAAMKIETKAGYVLDTEGIANMKSAGIMTISCDSFLNIGAVTILMN